MQYFKVFIGNICSYYFATVRSKRYCSQHVCMYVLCIYEHVWKPDVFNNFLRMVPVAMSWCSCDGILLCDVVMYIPVMWTTSCLHIIARHRLCERAYVVSDSPGGSTDLIQQPIQHILSDLPSTAPRAKFDIYDWLVVCRIVKACRAAERLAIEKFQSVEVTSACIVFILLLGQDTSLLRLYLQVANQLAEHSSNEISALISSQHSSDTNTDSANESDFVTKKISKSIVMTAVGVLSKVNWNGK